MDRQHRTLFTTIDNTTNAIQRKSILLTLLILLSSAYTFAQHVWRVEEVPNTRLQSNAIHVSDPDGLLSDSCEMRINTALGSIKDKADVFIVALGSIGDAGIEQFAVDLFDRWKIGDATTNNGVLILFAKEQRKLKFETGYGAESVLTDARCQDIFLQHIVPYFKEEDYEGGLCSCVAEIVSIYGGTIPTNLVTVLPDKTISDADDDTESSWAFSLLAILTAILPVFSAIALFHNKGSHTASIQTLELDKTIDEVPYYEEKPLGWTGNAWEGKGCLRAMLTGFSLPICSLAASFIAICAFTETESTRSNLMTLLLSIILYLTWICLRHNRRTLKFAENLALSSTSPKSVYQKAYGFPLTKATLKLAPWIAYFFHKKYLKKISESENCLCPQCHASTASHEGFSLSKQQQLESDLKVFTYRPLRCSNGHILVATAKGACHDDFYLCPDCGTRAANAIRTKIVTKATTTSEGLKEIETECKYCGKKSIVNEALPKIQDYSGGYSSDDGYSSSSHRSSYGSSHSSSGGSFGGGRSGGGGYTGSW